MGGINCIGFFLIKPCRVRVYIFNFEIFAKLVKAEDVAICRNRPAEQGQIVQQPLWNEASIAMQKQVALWVSL